jgi:hypothetical protein
MALPAPCNVVAFLLRSLIPVPQELALGTYDGIAGLFTQPVIGAMEEGPLGFVKGFGKGVMGTPFKFWAGKSLKLTASVR